MDNTASSSNLCAFLRTDCNTKLSYTWQRSFKWYSSSTTKPSRRGAWRRAQSTQ